MEQLYKDKEEYEAEKREQELEERRAEEEEARRLIELKAREQRKVKQLPEVQSLLERYQDIKSKIEKNVSEDHYIQLFDICYSIVTNWHLLKCLDEFENVWGYYEEQVLACLDDYPTYNSLYHVISFYTDRAVLWEIRDLSERKEHLLKGLHYVKDIYETTLEEEFAEQYLDVYGLLGIFCQNGEDLEQLNYAIKAYKLAKEFALKFQSENMIEALDTAKLGLTVYYRTHDQEEEALKVESESEKIIMQIQK